MPSPSSLVAYRKLEARLLQLYRYAYDGNKTDPDGVSIDTAITTLEQALKDLP